MGGRGHWGRAIRHDARNARRIWLCILCSRRWVKNRLFVFMQVLITYMYICLQMIWPWLLMASTRIILLKQPNDTSKFECVVFIRRFIYNYFDFQRGFTNSRNLDHRSGRSNAPYDPQPLPPGQQWVRHWKRRYFLASLTHANNTLLLSHK